MTRWVTPLIIIAVSFVGTRAYAQETGPGPGTAEVTVIPGGGMFFTSTDTEASFGNYNLGGAFTYNINPYVGVEGEIGGTLGITQDLSGLTGSEKTPNTLGYTGNLVVSAAARRGIVPYATGGIGGLTMFKKVPVGITENETFLTGNVGGGVKWYVNNRWGLRADYRFIMVRSTDTASVFFGQETRYGHRIYGAIIVNVVQ